jgi:hypothetical protein
MIINNACRLGSSTKNGMGEHKIYMGRHARAIVKTKLMHDPICFVAMRCSSFVEN